MNRQFIKNILICIGIAIGLSASSFLLVQEFSAIPSSYASSIDLSGNFSDKSLTMQDISKGGLTYSNFFSNADKQAEPVNVPMITQPESVKNPVEKTIVPRVRIGTTKCPAKKDRPSVSSRNNKNHMDEDCCSDYDEWPKPGCAYSEKDFEIMLPGPTKGHIKHR